MALERTSYRWLIGKKLYDPEKIRVFLETIWYRARLIHSEQGYVCIFQDDLDLLAEFSRKITKYLRTLKNRSEASHDGGGVATALFFTLRETTAKFLTIYFRLKRDGLTEPERRLECTYISRQPQYFIH